LAAALRAEVDRLRASRELRCSDEVAEKLKRISPSTIDRLLAHERAIRRLRHSRNPPMHPLLYQRIPVKVASEWDTSEVGNLQIDYVEHCGRSTGGEYIHTLSTVDIASGWWEGEPIPSRSQQATTEALNAIRSRAPFRIREIHPDNDTGLINGMVWDYCRKAKMRVSRSRPYRKNDNAWIEQRNWTEVRKLVGYERLETTAELSVLRQLYAQTRLYHNFFQPTMKLVEKVREGGKIHRRYDEPRTPYQRLMESGPLSARAKPSLREQYDTLNVAELRRSIDRLRDQLFDLVEHKAEPVAPKPRRGKGIWIGTRRQRWWKRQNAP
jgi:hypothetical protein